MMENHIEKSMNNEMFETWYIHIYIHIDMHFLRTLHCRGLKKYQNPFGPSEVNRTIISLEPGATDLAIIQRFRVMGIRV